MKVLITPDSTYVLQFENAEAAESACEKLNETDGVKYAEPDMLMSVDTTTASNDVSSISWGTTAVEASALAAELANTEYVDVTVAVVDTGVASHEMLGSRLLVGWDFVNADNDAADDCGHGTHVA